jgi:hypothetical protein
MSDALLIRYVFILNTCSNVIIPCFLDRNKKNAVLTLQTMHKNRVRVECKFEWCEWGRAEAQEVVFMQ